MGSFYSFHFDKYSERYRRSCFASTLENFEQKKTLKFHLELNFNNFQERENGIFKVECYDILTIWIDIIGFAVNIISKLFFTIILYLFLLQIFLSGEY